MTETLTRRQDSKKVPLMHSFSLLEAVTSGMKIYTTTALREGVGINDSGEQS